MHWASSCHRPARLPLPPPPRAQGLPLSLDLSWLEQKAVIILLALLHLNVKNIRIGPKAPAFLTPEALQVGGASGDGALGCMLVGSRRLPRCTQPTSPLPCCSLIVLLLFPMLLIPFLPLPPSRWWWTSGTSR